MRTCPKCKRLSLDYDPVRKRARCLYVTDCGYSEYVGDRETFAAGRDGTSSRGMLASELPDRASRATQARKG
jgi:hypothetical protein